MTAEDYAQLENKLYYAAFALVLNENKAMSANDMCKLVRDKFPPLLKWADKQTLSIILSRCKSRDLFVIATRRTGRPNTYALTPKFYSTLSDTIISETAGLSEMRGVPIGSEAGIMALHKHAKTRRYKRPTMRSVFMQARDALRRAG
ncbi:MAG: hypothetical protein AABX75_03050 [Nanoarchaeota archaeon]